MRVAFYAPLKSPDHAVPSGDREIARLLMRALALAGFDVELASRLRTFDREGNAERQARMATLGAAVVRRLVDRYRRDGRGPALWFTYHLHHKAPDVVGPAVCRALRIPYIVAEASVAAKQRDGAWRVGYAQSLDALRRAAGVVCLNPADAAGVRAVVASTPCEVVPPFVDAQRFTLRSEAGPGEPVRLVTVAMMRAGAKLRSYRLLADALRRIDTAPWRLAIVGDGPARREVAEAFATFPAGRIRFLGALDADAVAGVLRESDVFAWPAIDEAFGMALLEAQACGVPVVAGRSEGVASIVADGRSGLLADVGDAHAFATALDALIVDHALRGRLGAQAREHVLDRHDLPSAARSLRAFIARASERFAASAGRDSRDDGDA
jgi:glycosyltransferase involved in cell wall biosynthesis